MYDYDFEECYEPTMADEIMNEASEKLKEALKESVKSHYDSIIKENKALKAKNDELQKFVDEIDDIKHGLALEKSQLVNSARRQRLSELMKDFEVELFRVDYESVKKEKCGSCDDKRRIKFFSPSGKELYDNCSCDKVIGKNYFVKPYLCSEFRMDSNSSAKLTAFYKINREGTNDEYYGYESSIYCSSVLDHGYSDFENLNLNLNRETFFRSKEDAQKYCDYLNSTEDKPSEN